MATFKLVIFLLILGEISSLALQNFNAQPQVTSNIMMMGEDFYAVNDKTFIGEQQTFMPNNLGQFSHKTKNFAAKTINGGTFVGKRK